MGERGGLRRAGNRGDGSRGVRIRVEAEWAVTLGGGGVHGGTAVEIPESHPTTHSAVSKQRNLDPAHRWVPVPSQ